MVLLGTAVVLIGLCTIPYLYSLFVNYQKARSTGLPLVVCPINPLNPIWMVLSSLCGAWLPRTLPDWLWSRIRYAVYGWIYYDQQYHLELPAPVFMVVTSGKNFLWVADPTVADSILTRRKDFVVPDVARIYFGQFGPNVLTANGSEWSKYRKLFSQALNDRIYQRVWEASAEQAETMLQWALEQPGGRMRNVFEAARTIAINVTLSSEFDVPVTWQPSDVTSKSAAGASGLAWAMDKVARQWITVMTMPRRLLTSRAMPKGMQELGGAAEILPAHLQEAIEKEQKALQDMNSQRNSFLGLLLRHSDQDQKASNYISSAELQGNLLAFTLGSFETSSTTMTYAIALLAAHEDWQRWIDEELDAVINAKTSPIPNTDIMNQLPRCQAFMNEVLRLYLPINNTARAVESSQPLNVDGDTHVLPGDTQIAIAVGLMHTNPVWGHDRFEFNPARFLSDNVPKQYFMPFSRGARICPGQRMAQIEVIAVLATLFSKARVQPATEAGETLEAARRRLRGMIKDSQPQITLQMVRPNDVKLVWRLKSSQPP